MSVEPGQVYAFSYDGNKELLVLVLEPLHRQSDEWRCVVLHGNNVRNYPAGMVGTWSLQFPWARVL